MNLAAVFGQEIWAITRDAKLALQARAASVSHLVAQGLSAPQPLATGTAEKAAIAFNGGNPIVPEIVNGVATIQVMGDIIARAQWWAKAFLGAVDPFDVADAVDALAANDAVKALIIEVDSGGGTTNGTFEAAAAISRFQGTKKTVTVRAAGTIASAAYAMVASADKIIASSTTRVGSLGTMVILCDSTAANVASGERYEPIVSAPLKGLGMDGTITPALRAQMQRMVDSINAVFRDTVSVGRALTGAALEAVFTGDIWMGEQAKALGLIDAVDSAPEEPEQVDGDAVPPDPILPLTDPSDDDGQSAAASTTAASPQKESSVDANTIAALASLSAAHPTHAAAFVAEASKSGMTADSFRSFAAAHVAKAESAVELTAAKDAAAKAEQRAKDAETSSAAEKSRADKAETALAAQKAHGTAHADPGADGQESPSKTQEELDAMKPSDKAKFFAAGGRIAAKA